MISREMIDRINHLARKQKNRGLTKEEKEEQHALRQKYLECIRTQIINGLEEAGIQRKDQHQSCSGPNCIHRFKH